MKLGEICAAPCFAEAPGFTIPKPGCHKNALKFASSEGRSYYSVLLRNHDLKNSTVNPKVAIVGLSPAGSQIDEFVTAFRQTGDYSEASVRGAFAGLSADIVAMINGLGLASKIKLKLPQGTTLAHHPDVYVTSLVGCASLTDSGSSKDFDPIQYAAARRCITERFIEEITNSRFADMAYVLVLGAKGWKAINNITAAGGRSVHQVLLDAGKVVLNLPHPSGANREYINLAVLPLSRVPREEDYISEKWHNYRSKCRAEGTIPEDEGSYKRKRRTVWNAIYKLRCTIALLEERSP